MIDHIIATKKREVEVLRGYKILPRTKPVIPFRLRTGVNIIAELKKRSPSAGNIGEIDDRRIAVYAQYATAVSILTDTTYFGGSFKLLADIADKINIPILCKDFFIDESQINLAWSKGADLILLIARILEEDRLKTLYDYAQKLGIGCLVEVHEAKELKKIAGLNADIIGVNARDLDTLAIDLKRAREILSLVKAPVRVAESGIKSRTDIEEFTDANCFLIGETLMRSNDVETTLKSLLYG